MANPLTGDFDAVVQVSVPTVNRLLASMHQNRGDDAGPPPPHTLPHRGALSIGNKPLSGALAGIKGTAWVQIGVPTVALVANAPQSADVSCWIRARYFPNPKTVSLPEFIHGRIVARFDVKASKPFYGIPLGIRASASPDDAHITFTDSNLGSADSQKVTGLIRDYLRTRIDAFFSFLPDVPAGIFDFQALTDGQGRQAVALPIMLTGAPAGAGNVGRVFLDGSDFAIAISKEFILAQMQPAIEALNQAKPEFDVPALGMTAHYKASMTATVTWNGALTLKISGTAHTSHKKFGIKVFPDAKFEISQSFTLTFNASTQSISVTPSGGPNVKLELFNGLGKYYPPAKDKAKTELTNRFVTERDNALTKANQEINATLATQREQVRKLLQKVDGLAEVTLTSAFPDNDGVVLRGKISLSPRKQPRVEFSQLGDGSGYTAFDSWVPGGRIRQFVWTFWRYEDLKDQVPGEVTDSLVLPYNKRSLVDRFVLQEKNLPGITPFGASSGGTSVSTEPGGNFVVNTEAFSHMFEDPEAGLWIPPEGQVCVWLGYDYVDPVTGKILTESPTILGVVNFGAGKKLNPDIGCMIPLPFDRFTKPKDFPADWPCPGWNVIVTQPAESELVTGREVLLQAIRQAQRSDAAVMLVLASRIGSRGPSPALAARARELRRKFSRLGVLLADREASWLRDFDLPRDESRPAIRLVDPDGRLTWRHDGVPDVTAIAAALREHLAAGTPPRGRVLAASVQPGDWPPDFTFEFEPGERIALRNLRGRQLAVIFVSEGNAALDAVLNHLSAQGAEAAEITIGHYCPAWGTQPGFSC